MESFSMNAAKSAMEVALVENNAYDRAVLGVCFTADTQARLIYAIGDDRGLLSPSMLWQWLVGPAKHPDIVLFDLALTPWCGRVMASSKYRELLKNGSQGLRAMDLALKNWAQESGWALANVSISIRAAAETLSDTLPPPVATDLDKIRFTDRQRLLSAMQEANEVIRSSGSDRLHSLEKIVSMLWEGEETAWELAKAPSLLRFFVCATSFPLVCFGVVSHFADEDTRLALRTVLGARSRVPWSVERDRVLDQLIVNKAELFVSSEAGIVLSDQTMESLPLRLRKALRDWQILSSPAAMSAPFGGLPVVSRAATFGGSGKPASVQTIPFAEWCREHLPQAVGEGRKVSDAFSQCTVLLDQTLLLAGDGSDPYAWRQSGHDGWSMLVQSPYSLQREERLSTVTFTSDYHSCRLYLVSNPASSSDVDMFLASLQAGGTPTGSSCVVVGSQEPEIAARLDQADLEGDIRLYRIPPRNEWPTRLSSLFSPPFARKGVAESLVRELRVRDPENGRVHRFAESAKIYPLRRSLVTHLRRFLLDTANELDVAFKRVVDKVALVEQDLEKGRPLDAVLGTHGLMRSAKL